MGSRFGTTKCGTAFRNLEISNIKITKIKLFDGLFLNLFFISMFALIVPTQKYIYDNLPYWNFLEF